MENLLNELPIDIIIKSIEYLDMFQIFTDLIFNYDRNIIYYDINKQKNGKITLIATTIEKIKKLDFTSNIYIFYCMYPMLKYRNDPDLNIFNNKYVHTLILSSCHNITDAKLSALGNVYNLNLSFCDNITDVSKLGHVYNLNLSYCDKITEVYKLDKVYNLNFSYCNNITDVSALGNVHTLNLSNCNNITDVSALGNVYNLNLSYCNNRKDTLDLDILLYG